MPLGTKVNLGPGDVLLDGVAASPPLKEAQPQFSFHVYCGQTAGWMKTPLGTEVDLGPCLVSATKGAQHRALFGPCLLWRRSAVSATGELLLFSVVLWCTIVEFVGQNTIAFGGVCYCAKFDWS